MSEIYIFFKGSRKGISEQSYGYGFICPWNYGGSP